MHTTFKCHLIQKPAIKAHINFKVVIFVKAVAALLQYNIRAVGCHISSTGWHYIVKCVFMCKFVSRTSYQASLTKSL